MIDISEEKFIEYLKQYANNEISMPKLIEKLRTDFRTVYNKIMEISATNPDLYYQIVTSHPYKQRSRTDIDYEALMIYVLKHGLTIQDAVDTFHVSRKTIQRRVNETKEKNPELYDLFKSAIGRGG